MYTLKWGEAVVNSRPRVQYQEGQIPPKRTYQSQMLDRAIGHTPETEVADDPNGNDRQTRTKVQLQFN